MLLAVSSKFRSIQPCAHCFLIPTIVNVFLQDVADKFNIPKYVLYTSPSSTLALMSYVPTLQKLGRLPVGTEPFNDIPGLAPTKAADMPSMMLNHKYIPEVYAFFLRNCARLPDARGVLVNTFEELEHKILEGIRERIYGELSPLVTHATQAPEAVVTMWSCS